MHVPEGWGIGRINDLLKGLESGVSVNGEDRPLLAGENGVLKVSSVSYGYFNPHAVKFIYGKELARAKVSPRKDNIIISRSNTENLVGASAYVNQDYPNLFLSDKLWQTVAKDNVQVRWLSYILSSSYVRYTLSNLATGTSGSMKNITQKEFLDLKIPIPPLAEQEKIAEILSTWDDAIEQTERLKTNAEIHKKALMQQLLTGKKRLLDENGERFSEEWKKTKLGGFINEFSRRNKNNKIQTVLSISNRIGFTLPENQFSKRVASQDLSNYKIVKKGMFGYNPSRINVGSLGRLDEQEEGVLSPMYVVFKIDEDFLNSDYLLFWFSSYEARYRIESGAQGSVRETLNFDAMRAFPFKLPPLEEQQKIASVLNTADREIELLTQKIEHLKIEKRALMQQLLTGKRRVKVDG